MKRVQLFEFEDFSWLPSFIRSGMTKLIVVLHKITGTKELLSELLFEVHQKTKFTRIVDMGSGSGGIMPATVDHLRKNKSLDLNLILTDLNPNEDFVKNFNSKNPENIRYQLESLNACDLQDAPEGLKTMVNSFHHMPPKYARSILKTAFDNREPILIYEIAENKIPLLVWWLLLPISLLIVFIMALLMTPFTKPLKLSQIVFTYIIPVIPLLYAWDGQASMPRMYSYSDMNLMLQDLRSEEYEWKVEKAVKSNGKGLGYYILGVPIKFGDLH